MTYTPQFIRIQKGNILVKHKVRESRIPGSSSSSRSCFLKALIAITKTTRRVIIADEIIKSNGIMKNNRLIQKKKN